VLSELLAPPLCWGCGDIARRGEPLCLRCRRALRHLGGEQVDLAGVRTWSAVAYEGAARELVRGLKFRGAVALAEAMAAVIVANAPEEVLPRTVSSGGERSALIPVPLHPARQRRRGFNQAAVLAGALGRRTGLPVADCLVRSGASASQVGRPRGARLSAPPGRIDARDSAPGLAVLVDDVATTGATLAACARALRAAGSWHVTALTFARTLGR
jgi:ComF family protein